VSGFICVREKEFAVGDMPLAVDGVQVEVDTNDGVHMCLWEKEIAVGGVFVREKVFAVADMFLAVDGLQVRGNTNDEVRIYGIVYVRKSERDITVCGVRLAWLAMVSRSRATPRTRFVELATCAVVATP